MAIGSAAGDVSRCYQSRRRHRHVQTPPPTGGGPVTPDGCDIGQPMKSPRAPTFSDKQNLSEDQTVTKNFGSFFRKQCQVWTVTNKVLCARFFFAKLKRLI